MTLTPQIANGVNVRIYSDDNKKGAEWLARGLNLDPTYTTLDNLPQPGSSEFLKASESIKDMLRLDKPDLIVAVESGGSYVPVVSVEITATTPQSQHAKQRFPRLIAAAEAGIPAIYIIAASKRSGNSVYALGPDAYFCCDKITKINQTPVLIYEYPDDDGFLLNEIPAFPNNPRLDSPSMIEAMSTIKRLVTLKLSEATMDETMKDSRISGELQKQKAKASGFEISIDTFGTLKLIKTKDLYGYIQQNSEITTNRLNFTWNWLPDRIIERDNSLIFQPTGRMFDHAGDPYTGMIAFFDYAFCREGRTVEDRSMNLIYMPLNPNVRRITDEFSPSGYHSFYENSCPFRLQGIPSNEDQFKIAHALQYGCVYLKNKPLKIYGYFSDLIVFEDSLLVF
ncbi:hypothetical protein FIM08_01965 [SAR202 cluster bacterium AC-647-N09_OGT_505m]|nr:hypothetical protein [SAR202 cluster bacterium AC-647-N09_OGT_505m]